jgi:molybdate transport system ATP-binding protein
MTHSDVVADIGIRLQLLRPGFTLDVDMVLPGRGITVLYGPSGCGKTTVLRCVAGLEPRATGRVNLGEQIWLDSANRMVLPTHRRKLGYVFQEASLFAHLNVAQNIGFGLRRSTARDAGDALNAAVELLGIGHLLARAVQDLSGGERQRVAIARALATQPELLLLDEPLAALDTARKQEVMPWLERLRDELRIPILYVTHSLDELTRLGDHLVLMDAGRVMASGALPGMLPALGVHLGNADDQIGMRLPEGPGVPKGMLKGAAWRCMEVDVDGQRVWALVKPLCASDSHGAPEQQP